MHSTSQYDLLRERRFAPFFWTQFLGAGNDNIYKNALIIFVAFEAAHDDLARRQRARQSRRRRLHRAVHAVLGDRPGSSPTSTRSRG